MSRRQDWMERMVRRDDQAVTAAAVTAVMLAANPLENAMRHGSTHHLPREEAGDHG